MASPTTTPRTPAAVQRGARRKGAAAFLNSFNYFRGIAIVVIVAGHCFDLADWQAESFTERLVRNLIAGGSCLFVFISGFLFHHVFYPRFDYRTFIAAKVRNVLSPYLILSALPIAYHVVRRKPHFDGYFLPQGQGVFAEYIVPALKYLYTGAFFIPYWYIPFIMLMFALSPLHVAFIRWRPSVRLAVVLTLLAFALFVHRPVHNFNVLQSLVYFLPVYLLGIVCSQHREWLYRNLTGREPWLLTVVLAIALWQTLGVGHVGNFNKPLFTVAGVDWVLLQKALLCPVLMVVLHRFESRHWPLLGLLASASFGIYFMHAWVLALAYGIKDGRALGISPYVAWPLGTALVVALSVAVAWLAKLVLRKQSRRVVGW